MLELNKPLKILLWSTGSIICFVLALAIHNGSNVDKNSGALAGLSFIFLVMAFQTLLNNKEKRSEFESESDGSPGSIACVEQVLSAFKRANIPFSRKAKSLVSNEIVGRYYEHPVTAELVIFCLGKLKIRGRLKNSGVAAANNKSGKRLAAAVKKISPVCDEALYATTAFDLTVVVRLSDYAINSLNSELAGSGVKFEPYRL